MTNPKERRTVYLLSNLVSQHNPRRKPWVFCLTVGLSEWAEIPVDFTIGFLSAVLQFAGLACSGSLDSEKFQRILQFSARKTGPDRP